MAATRTKIDLLVDRMVIRPVGWNKFWSLRNRIEIPFRDIVSVKNDHRLAENGPVGIRIPGTNIPGVYLAGTFWKFWGGVNVRSFWIRRHAERCVTIHLHDNFFDYVTVDVNDPDAEVAHITNTLRNRGIILPETVDG